MQGIFSVLVASSVLCSVAGNLVTVVQSETGKGAIQSLKTGSGEINVKSDVSFTFDWPLVQMTHKSDDRSVYIVTYPEEYPGAVLYKLDEETLKPSYTWENISFSFFDLQYSSKQSTLYGIFVSSTYGRVLSNFTAKQDTNELLVNQLFTLPYMWYVNASSFHHPSCHYYALINNFPGKENSTLDQQLVVADFSVDASIAAPKVDVLPISNPRGIVQFLAYSDSQSSLYYAGIQFNSTTVEVGTLDPATGLVKGAPQWTREAFEDGAGPLVVSETGRELLIFIKSATDTWQLWSLPFHAGLVNQARVVRTYTGAQYKYFAASIATA